MKTRIGASAEYPNPTPEPGCSVWIENGVWFTAPTVDPEKFGYHDYVRAYGVGVGPCRCGCEMHGASSNGPVDPFGACPLNPKENH